jgi:hypothetical protein
MYYTEICLLLDCMSHTEEPIFEEEPRNPIDSADVVACLSENEGKSHRSSWSYVYAWCSLEL